MKLLVITQKVNREDQLLGFFIDWLNEFAKQFQAVEVLCLEKGQANLSPGIKVKSLGKERGLSRLQILFNFYKFIIGHRDRYDAVFVHMNPIWVILGAPFWGWLDKKVFLWYAHKSVTAKLKVAEFLADGVFSSTPEGFRLASRKIIFIGQGIDTSRFCPADIPSNKTMISVGRLAPVKRHEISIRTLAVLRQLGHIYHLDIVGAPVWHQDFAYEAELKKLVRDLDLEDQVSFWGKVNTDELPGLYQKNYWNLNFSQTGSLDKTILEAMACGCVPISSNDAAKAVLPSKLTVPAEPSQVAGRILELQNENLRDSMVEYVRREHSLEGLISKIKSGMAGIRTTSSVLVVGYAYVRENYRRTFDFYPKSGRVGFILPRSWPVKNGSFVYLPPERDNIFKTWTVGFHSNYPVIGGLFKGWMPPMPIRLLQHRDFNLLFNCNEPNSLTALYNSIWAKLLGMKVVLFSWENIPYDFKFRGLKGRIQRAIIKLNLYIVDGLICGNSKGMEIFSKLTDVSIETIPLSGLDTEFFRPDPEKVSGDSIKILFAGSLSYRKGIHVALESFRILIRDFPSAQFEIVGSGEYENELKSKVKDLGLEGRVSFMPWLSHEQLREIFQAADIFIYPSLKYKGWKEQFGYSIAEASLCGLPVIASRSGSIPDLVKDRETGILVSENDPKALYQAMKELTEAPELRKRMGKNGRKFISENFSYERVANKFFNYFNNLNL